MDNKSLTQHLQILSFALPENLYIMLLGPRFVPYYHEIWFCYCYVYFRYLSKTCTELSRRFY